MDEHGSHSAYRQQADDGLNQLAALVRARRTVPPPEELRAIRDEAGVTREELAAAIGVSAQAIAYWETGARRPRPHLLDRYLSALKVLREAATCFLLLVVVPAFSLLSARQAAPATESVERLLTGDEVSQLLGVPRKTLYAWQYRGGGPPAIRVGRYTRYRARDVAAWIDGLPASG